MHSNNNSHKTNISLRTRTRTADSKLERISKKYRLKTTKLNERYKVSTFEKCMKIANRINPPNTLIVLRLKPEKNIKNASSKTTPAYLQTKLI